MEIDYSHREQHYLDYAAKNIAIVMKDCGISPERWKIAEIKFLPIRLKATLSLESYGIISAAQRIAPSRLPSGWIRIKSVRDVENVVSEKNFHEAVRSHAIAQVTKDPIKFFFSSEDTLSCGQWTKSYATVATCSACGGEGRYTCYSCNGNRTQICTNCGGACTYRCGQCQGSGRVYRYGVDGRQHPESCGSCSGGMIRCGRCFAGRVPCVACGQLGKVTCSSCGGAGEYSELYTISCHAKLTRDRQYLNWPEDCKAAARHQRALDQRSEFAECEMEFASAAGNIFNYNGMRPLVCGTIEVDGHSEPFAFMGRELLSIEWCFLERFIVEASKELTNKLSRSRWSMIWQPSSGMRSAAAISRRSVFFGDVVNRVLHHKRRSTLIADIKRMHPYVRDENMETIVNSIKPFCRAVLLRTYLQSLAIVLGGASVTIGLIGTPLRISPDLMSLSILACLMMAGVITQKYLINRLLPVNYLPLRALVVPWLLLFMPLVAAMYFIASKFI